MITDGKPHPIDYFKENIYDIVEVDESNYSQYYQKGIYKNIEKVKIIPGMKKIKFRYYSNENTLIEADSVPIMYDGQKGEKGDNGTNGKDRLSTYQGITNDISTIDVSNLTKNDFYFNVSDGWIYRYNAAGSSYPWDKLEGSYADYESYYRQAVSDGFVYYKSLPSTTPLLTAINIWVENLVANTAMIQKIFTYKVEVDADGAIQSKDFSTNASTGFKLDSNGIYVNNGTFKGNIDSGPLYLSKDSQQKIVSATIGATIYDSYYSLRNQGVTENFTYTVSGLLNGSYTTSLRLTTDSSSNIKQTYYEDAYNATKYSSYYLVSVNEYKLEEKKYITNIIGSSNTASGNKAINYNYARIVKFKFPLAIWEQFVDGSSEYQTIPDLINSGKYTEKTEESWNEITSYTDYTGYISGTTQIDLTSGSKTMLWRDLPLASTGVPGSVWSDTAGYLHWVRNY